VSSKPKKTKNLKKFLKNEVFSSPDLRSIQLITESWVSCSEGDIALYRWPTVVSVWPRLVVQCKRPAVHQETNDWLSSAW